jgi:hypothetical protein
VKSARVGEAERHVEEQQGHEGRSSATSDDDREKQERTGGRGGGGGWGTLGGQEQVVRGGGGGKCWPGDCRARRILRKLRGGRRGWLAVALRWLRAAVSRCQRLPRCWR